MAETFSIFEFLKIEVWKLAASSALPSNHKNGVIFGIAYSSYFHQLLSASYSSEAAQDRQRNHPPAMAPIINNGSAPLVTAVGRGVSADSCERSCSQAKKRMNGRRHLVT